ncbi:polyprenyl synthetase family protein [bacterium]|nr:polyprenyl synthetase family protein [bacterium]
MNFKSRYENIKNLAKYELSIIEKKMIERINTREPLNTLLKGFLTSPSKRIRSVLAILYSKALEEDLSDEQLEFLSVVELVHNASLIHDDIIDESKLRRGHKTISAEFDNKLAVISGDYILAISMEKLALLGNTQLLENFSKTIKQMCLGEINQNFDRFKIGTIEDYIEKTKNKTAYLFETALTGCIMLSKTYHNIEVISQLATNIGVAFQIRDDISNMTSSDNSKPIKNDIKEGIYNAPVILGDKSDNYHSGIEKTKTLLNNYVQSAKEQIQQLPDNKFKTALYEFLELLKDV